MPSVPRARTFTWHICAVKLIATRRSTAVIAAENGISAIANLHVFGASDGRAIGTTGISGAALAFYSISAASWRANFALSRQRSARMSRRRRLGYESLEARHM